MIVRWKPWRGIGAASVLVAALAVATTAAQAQNKDKGARQPPAAVKPESGAPAKKGQSDEREKGRARPVDPDGCPLDGERKLEMIV